VTVSAAFLVKDPPLDRLAMLLEYIQPVIDEAIIVVDSRTREETFDLLNDRWFSEFRCPVYATLFTWVDDFSAARNEAVRLANHDWILHLDPDELPSAAMLEFIRQVTSEPLQEDVKWQGATYLAPRGYLFFTSNFFDGERGEEWEEHWHCRLFRRKSGVWYKPVHEQVMLDGRPESYTRGTPLLPKAPRSAYLIHSRMNRVDIDAQYVAIEKAQAVS
jgi:hypothetical protein